MIDRWTIAGILLDLATVILYPIALLVGMVAEASSVPDTVPKRPCPFCQKAVDAVFLAGHINDAHTGNSERARRWRAQAHGPPGSSR